MGRKVIGYIYEDEENEEVPEWARMVVRLFFIFLFIIFCLYLIILFIASNIREETDLEKERAKYKNYQQELIELAEYAERYCSDDYVKVYGNGNCFLLKERLEAHKKHISENKNNIQNFYNKEIAELDQQIKEICKTEKDKCASVAIAKEDRLKEIQHISVAQFYIEKYCVFAPRCEKSKDIIVFNGVGYGGNLCTALKCKYKSKCPSKEPCENFKKASKYLKTWNELKK
jgi:hypothetical protein